MITSWTPTTLSIFVEIGPTGSALELGRYRYFRSVSVFGIFALFFKVGVSIGVGILKYRGIGIGVGIFSRPLLVPVSARSLSCPGFQTVGIQQRLFYSIVCAWIFVWNIFTIHVKLSVLDDEICVPVIEFLRRVGLVVF